MGTEDPPNLTNAQLCRAMKDSEFPFTDVTNQLPNLQSYVLKVLKVHKPDFVIVAELECKLKTFLSHVMSRYRKSSRNFEAFMGHPGNKIFLSNSFIFPLELCEVHDDSEASPPVKKAKQNKPGRQALSFEEKSLRGQQLASALVRQQHESGAINLAASQQNTPLGKLIRKTNSPSGSTARLALSAVKSSPKPAIQKKSPDEALGFLLSNHLTKTQYSNMKMACAHSNADLWPNYNKVLEAKRVCRPSEINYQELSASVQMQDLMNHTSIRVLENNPVVADLSQNMEKLDLVFFFKFGFDGCGSFSTFNQKSLVGGVPDGSTLVVSQLVPLQIVVQNQPNLIVYKNNSPNSANSCRPLRLSYERETKENIRCEASRLKQEADQLQPLIISENPLITVHFKGLFTLVDGKVLQELTNCPASSSCPLCHKTFKEISMPFQEFEPKEGTLQYGASILHFGLRAFECLCHIAYKQDVKKSRVRLTPEEKEILVQREKDVKLQFLNKLGLVVDQRRDGGAGNTTTGNVARKAFKNADITAEICGVPKQLVENLGIIWGALSCGFEVDPEKFASICKETEEIYFDKKIGVGWFSLPATVHKILKHGAEIIKACPVPIGLTNEEASEANNKFTRRFRLHHSRKSSWHEGVKDLFNRLMDISDPVIQESLSSSKVHKTAKRKLSSQILSLLKAPTHLEGDFEVEKSSSDASDDESS